MPDQHSELVTGRVRVRRTLFGRCVLQIEVAEPSSPSLQSFNAPKLRWRDAKGDDLVKNNDLWPLCIGTPLITLNVGRNPRG